LEGKSTNSKQEQNYKTQLKKLLKMIKKIEKKDKLTIKKTDSQIKREKLSDLDSKIMNLGLFKKKPEKEIKL